MLQREGQHLPVRVGVISAEGEALAMPMGGP